MGAWGPGSFENDDALDFVGGLTPETIERQVRDVLAAVHLNNGAEVDATASAHAPAAAEFVAAGPPAARSGRAV